jgi:H+/Cl- antiporter ClcA
MINGMKWIRLAVSSVIIGIGVALTYHYFELATNESIDFIWGTWLQTGSIRLLVVPLCIVLTLSYFGARHYLDKPSEAAEGGGLGTGAQPAAKLRNYLTVLFVGYLSLLAGASLGPEAILIPASMLIGSMVGKRLFTQGDKATKILPVLGFVALLTAFFSSIITGMLGLLFIVKQKHERLTVQLVVLAAFTSLAAYGVLRAFSSASYFVVPSSSHQVRLIDVLALVGLIGIGFGMTYLLGWFDRGFTQVHKLVKKWFWWQQAVVASAGLSALYLLGGPLVQFTGNQNVSELLNQSASLGAIGLLWILVIKLAAISWSKVSGYRGGMIFPAAFAASVAVAAMQLYVTDLNFTYGMAAVLVGLFLANRKIKTLL